jgi:hypothetical protein
VGTLSDWNEWSGRVDPGGPGFRQKAPRGTERGYPRWLAMQHAISEIFSLPCGISLSGAHPGRGRHRAAFGPAAVEPPEGW